MDTNYLIVEFLFLRNETSYKIILSDYLIVELSSYISIC
jgi:hypothetical protein